MCKDDSIYTEGVWTGLFLCCSKTSIVGEGKREDHWARICLDVPGIAGLYINYSRANTQTKQHSSPTKDNFIFVETNKYFLSVAVLGFISIMNSASISSDFYASFLRHSSVDMVSSDGGGDLFFSDPFVFPLYSPTDVFHQIPNNQTYQHTLDNTPSSLEAFSPSFFSFSPPSTHLENLSLYQSNPVQPVSNGPNLETEFGNFSVLDGFKVKSEECQMGVDYNCNQNFVPHNYNGSENVSKSMQRSYSSNSFDGKPGFLFQPHYDTFIDSSNFQSQALNSPENNQVRRACSTGDLQNMISTQTTLKEGSFLEEANFKVRRYTAEERKERISKYRAKRNQRNFNKTIKYACRKTLADNRPRIRGRFARNDETGENPKAPCSTRNEEEIEFWFEGLHEEQEDISVRAEQYLSSYGDPQFQYHGFRA